jgi:cellulose synthase/poly-beta-1,6-N-acetylglucosamine synthase-like glycosyltransferase
MSLGVEITTLLSCILAIAALCLLVPAAVFFSEILAASAARLLPARSLVIDRSQPRHPVAVLVPAHNEAAGIQATLQDLKRQLHENDRLVVIADNCSDNTSAVAAALGAEVIERDEPNKIGKGYALEYGLNYLTLQPPEILIVIDADCRVSNDAVDHLARTCTKTGRPVQALDLMTAPAGSPMNHQVAEFAWRVKNWVRPLGLSWMHLPCQLMGTGMAFPWDIIRSANLSNGFIAEDLKLGLELCQKGHSPFFCPSAIVTSTFPYSIAGTDTQRQRWEQGHLKMIRRAAPLLSAGLAKGNLALLVLVLDVMIPPISMFVLISAASILVAGIATGFGITPHAFFISAISFVFVFAAVFLGWLQFGRDLVPIRSFPLIPKYLVSKAILYGHFLAGQRIRSWVRTDRSSGK